MAAYCSKYLPDCIKDSDLYRDGELGPALVDAFLKFDSTLVEEDVIKELKTLAGDDENEEEEEGGVLLLIDHSFQDIHHFRTYIMLTR